MLDQVIYQEEGVRVFRWMLHGTLDKPLLAFGPSGVGKRFAVNQLVRELFCSGAKTDACDCHDCMQLQHGVHPDLWQVSAGDKDIGIGDSRGALAFSRSCPTQAPYRTLVFEGVDCLTIPAANALLKVLEEPPRTTRFLLLAENLSLVIPTIRSRCGLVPFHAWPEEGVLERMRQYEEDPAKALVYVRLGEGSIGETLKLWGAGRISFRDAALTVLQNAKDKKYPQLITSFEMLIKDLELSVRFLDLLLYDLVRLSHGLPVWTNSDKVEQLCELNKGVEVKRWFQLQRGLQEARTTYRKTKINLGFHMKSVLIDAFV